MKDLYKNVFIFTKLLQYNLNKCKKGLYIYIYWKPHRPKDFYNFFSYVNTKKKYTTRIMKSSSQ